MEASKSEARRVVEHLKIVLQSLKALRAATPAGAAAAADGDSSDLLPATALLLRRFLAGPVRSSAAASAVAEPPVTQWPPLFVACLGGAAEFVAELLTVGSAGCVEGHSSVTAECLAPMHCAVLSGSAATVEALLCGCDRAAAMAGGDLAGKQILVDPRTAAGDTPLLLACRLAAAPEADGGNDWSGIVSLLLAAGANPNAATATGVPTLHLLLMGSGCPLLFSTVAVATRLLACSTFDAARLDSLGHSALHHLFRVPQQAAVASSCADSWQQPHSCAFVPCTATIHLAARLVLAGCPSGSLSLAGHTPLAFHQGPSRLARSLAWVECMRSYPTAAAVRRRQLLAFVVESPATADDVLCSSAAFPHSFSFLSGEEKERLVAASSRHPHEESRGTDELSGDHFAARSGCRRVMRSLLLPQWFRNRFTTTCGEAVARRAAVDRYLMELRFLVPAVPAASAHSRLMKLRAAIRLLLPLLFIVFFLLASSLQADLYISP